MPEYGVTIANRHPALRAALSDHQHSPPDGPLAGSNWTEKLGIAAKLHAQWTNSAANSPCLGCADGEVQSSLARAVPSLASISFNIISFLPTHQTSASMLLKYLYFEVFCSVVLSLRDPV